MREMKNGTRILLWAVSSMGIASAALGASPAHNTESFYLTAPGLIAQTHGGQLGAGFRKPATIARFDPAIRQAAAFMFEVRDQAGRVVGFATEQEIHQLDAAGAITGLWSSTWTITLPGRGAIFLSQEEDGRSLIAAITPKAGEVWKGSVTRQTTVEGTGKIVGGTGEFVGRTGSFIEIDQFTEYDPKGTDGPIGTDELRLTFDPSR